MRDEVTKVRAVRVPRARVIAAPDVPAALARGTRDDIAFQATPQLLREVARAAFLDGFACSGEGFNGETMGAAGACRALLVAEFDRRWALRHPR